MTSGLPDAASNATPGAMNSSDQAYRVLRERILSGSIKPGEVLKERDLCEELNISRTPIREALRRLSADGLADVRPRRSIIVTSFDETELAEIFELGIVLESFVAALAAEKAKPDDLLKLSAIVDQMEAMLAQSPPDASEQYIKLDQAFHDAIAATARNPRIAQILRQTMSFRVLHNIFERYVPTDFATSLAQHKTIIGAIASGDPDWSRSAMTSHVRTGQAAQNRRG